MSSVCNGNKPSYQRKICHQRQTTEAHQLGERQKNHQLTTGGVKDKRSEEVKRLHVSQNITEGKCTIST